MIRLMIKHILIAVTTALLVLPNLSSTILADPPEVPVFRGDVDHDDHADSACLAAEHDGEISRVEAAMPEESAGRLAVLFMLVVLRQVHVESQAPR